EAGLLTHTPPRSVELTEQGRHSGLAALGLSKLPARATWRMLQATIAARAVNCRGVDADALRRAIVRRWLRESDAGGATEPNTRAVGAPRHGAGTDSDGGRDVAATPPHDPPAVGDLSVFAERVLGAARASSTGRFGGKVFISHVWRRVAPPGADGSVPAQEFKDRLLDAHRAGLLDLSRADLVEAMDPADVRASEVRYFGATFHFVRLQAAQVPKWPTDSGSHP